MPVTFSGSTSSSKLSSDNVRVAMDVFQYTLHLSFCSRGLMCTFIVVRSGVRREEAERVRRCATRESSRAFSRRCFTASGVPTAIPVGPDETEHHQCRRRRWLRVRRPWGRSGACWRSFAPLRRVLDAPRVRSRPPARRGGLGASPDAGPPSSARINIPGRPRWGSAAGAGRRTGWSATPRRRRRRAL